MQNKAITTEANSVPIAGESERFVLSYLLSKSTVLALKVIRELRPEDFVDKWRRRIFEAIACLAQDWCEESDRVNRHTVESVAILAAYGRPLGESSTRERQYIMETVDDYAAEGPGDESQLALHIEMIKAKADLRRRIENLPEPEKVSQLGTSVDCIQEHGRFRLSPGDTLWVQIPLDQWDRFDGNLARRQYLEKLPAGVDVHFVPEGHTPIAVHEAWAPDDTEPMKASRKGVFSGLDDDGNPTFGKQWEEFHQSVDTAAIDLGMDPDQASEAWRLGLELWKSKKGLDSSE